VPAISTIGLGVVAVLILKACGVCKCRYVGEKTTMKTRRKILIRRRRMIWHASKEAILDGVTHPETQAKNIKR